ncbi:MAG: hydrogenase maturation protease [bacterium]|nr:hydrogenase maturation protease [bacterium]
MGKKIAIGIGNYLMQDDGVGPKVIEQICLRELDQDFEAEDISTDGLRLFRHFNYETEKIVIIDSAFMGQEPGTVMVFSPDQLQTQKKNCQPISTHEGDILNLINLGKMLNLPIPEIKIVAVEPQKVDPGDELSPCLKEKMDEVIRQVVQELSC